MITHLSIRHFGIVKQVDLTCLEGMSVITGQTGAGKSILLDALGYCLGARAEAGVVRHGETLCDIIATFDLSRIPKALTFLKTHELGNDTTCLIRRTLHADGRSRSYINGIPCPLQLTKELGESVLHIHAQHEHQSLLKKDAQRQRLDSYGQLKPLLARCQTLQSEWQTIQAQLQSLEALDKNPAAIALLSYQLAELQELDLGETEYLSLQQQHKQLSVACELIETSGALLTALSDEQGALATCDLALRQCHALIKTGAPIQPISDLLEQARVHLQEALHDAEHWAEQIQSDPAELNRIEQRLSQIETVARKHQINPAELPHRFSTLQAEQAAIQAAESQITALHDQRAAVMTAFAEASLTCHQARKKAAKRLEQAVLTSIAPLGMKQARFEIQITYDDKATPSATGADEVQFLFSANPGQPLKPLQKVASGGELSRLALANQVLTAEQDQTPTLLFDEVDVGIGGEQAAIVGKMMRKLGETTQIICVTHQPQVAACTHWHYTANKKIEGDSTEADIQLLDRKAQIEEIARMLAGMNITERTRAHANELLSLATIA